LEKGKMKKAKWSPAIFDNLPDATVIIGLAESIDMVWISDMDEEEEGSGDLYSAYFVLQGFNQAS
jgi:hypothetical protein